MNLKQATDQAEQALEARDFKALALALQARRQALRSGEPPTLENIAAGDRVLRRLLELQRGVAFESARLGQIQRYVEFRKPAD